jgi:hypothetical protein
MTKALNTKSLSLKKINIKKDVNDLFHVEVPLSSSPGIIVENFELNLNYFKQKKIRSQIGLLIKKSTVKEFHRTRTVTLSNKSLDFVNNKSDSLAQATKTMTLAIPKVERARSTNIAMKRQFPALIKRKI